MRARTYRVRTLEATGYGQDSVATPPKSVAMKEESRFEQRLDRLIGRAQTPRTAAILIASVTTSMMLVAGVLMAFIDKKNFPTIGTGLWWSVQTVTTVGYGDITPSTWEGRLLAAVVMLLGIGFITVVTASITSSFVAHSSRKKGGGGEEQLSERHLGELHERLDRIEAMLREKI